LATIISQEVGMPMTLSGSIQVGLPAGAFADAAKAAEAFEWEEEMGNSLIVHEPVGVVGAITPWNFPLYQVVLKVAPALAAGCTVVLKPSEVAPLNAFVLTEVIHEVGLPPGVFNMVTGVGPVVGEAIAAHPKVDMVSFTGSTRAGKRVMELASDSIKRVSLELGGKSANILLDDADFAAAVPAGVFACYMNSGQTCSALTRMLVPRDRLAEVEELAAGAAAGFAPGDPFEAGKLLGPLVSAVQRDRVRGYINKGIEEGAKLVIGGADAPEGLETGFFVQPTVFSNVTRDMTIAREEIFGPVLSIIPYDTEEEAIEIANDTPYGLAGGVWSGDPARAEKVARQMRTGQVDINGGAFNPSAPFGGYKQSGIGRERGRYGLEEYVETKAMQR
jgi:aldehyde dehydrogenase (NAD+)